MELHAVEFGREQHEAHVGNDCFVDLRQFAQDNIFKNPLKISKS